jgi:hypothetical protein
MADLKFPQEILDNPLFTSIDDVVELSRDGVALVGIRGETEFSLSSLAVVERDSGKLVYESAVSYDEEGSVTVFKIFHALEEARADFPPDMTPWKIVRPFAVFYRDCILKLDNEMLYSVR